MGKKNNMRLYEYILFWLGTAFRHLWSTTEKFSATIICCIGFLSWLSRYLPSEYDYPMPVEFIMSLNEWQIIAGVLAFIILVRFILAPYWIHKETANKIESRDIEIAGLKRDNATLQELAKGKIDIERGLLDDFKSAKVAWGLWFAGTNIKIDKVLDEDIEGRILLLKPYKSDRNLQEVSRRAEVSLLDIIKDVETLTEKALSTNRFQVGWRSAYPCYSLTIFDSNPTKGKSGEIIPSSDSAWIVIKYLDPKVGAKERTIQRIYKETQLKKFEGYFEEYQRIWDNRDKLKLENGSIIVETEDGQQHTYGKRNL